MASKCIKVVGIFDRVYLLCHLLNLKLVYWIDVIQLHMFELDMDSQKEEDELNIQGCLQVDTPER